MSKPFSKYKAISFDCYGTLIDWETGIWDAAQALLMKNKCTSINRDLLLQEFAVWETKFESAYPKMPYPNLLSNIHENIAQKYQLISTQSMDTAFGASVPHWPAFYDTAEALRRLKNRTELFILSNVDRKSFHASNLKLGVEFTAVYTAEEIGSYKPNFLYMIESLEKGYGIQRHEILHTAQSLHHDIVEAKAQGLNTAWIDRQQLSTGGKWGATALIEATVNPDYLFFNMSEMVDSFLQDR